MAMTRHWIAVASANHVAIGRAQGFMQVNHGKAAPLKRIAPGDVVAYYSPTRTFGGDDRLQAFTAIGVVKPGEPYQGVMAGDFKPFRRDVGWVGASPAPIAPLLPQLSFAGANRNWGYRLRFGLFEVEAADMALIAAAMQAAWPLGADAD